MPFERLLEDIEYWGPAARLMIRLMMCRQNQARAWRGSRELSLPTHSGKQTSGDKIPLLVQYQIHGLIEEDRGWFLP
jgi:hypothetical protein